MDQTNVLLLAMAALAVASFMLGWNAASHRERTARREARNILLKVLDREREMMNWVRETWPTEYSAYYLGHKEGYQQGVLHAAEMEARAEETE